MYLIHAGLAVVTFLGVLGLLLPQGRSVQVSGAAGVVWLGLAAMVSLERVGLEGGGRGGRRCHCYTQPCRFRLQGRLLARSSVWNQTRVEGADSSVGAPPAYFGSACRRGSRRSRGRGAAGDVLCGSSGADGPQPPWCLTGRLLFLMGAWLTSLMQTGAGRWVGEHYLAVSAVAYGPPALELAYFCVAPEAVIDPASVPRDLRRAPGVRCSRSCNVVPSSYGLYAMDTQC